MAYANIGTGGSRTTYLLPSTSPLRIKTVQVIVLEGDSVTAGFQDGVGANAAYAWHVPIRASITALFTGAGLATPTYVNTGVGGNTTTDMLAGVATVTAANPDHVIVLCGLNDHFNHGGTPIPPATTQANYTAYFAAVKVSRPNCKFHVLSNLFYASENWPDGVGADDAAVQASNAAAQTATALESAAEWIDIRTSIFGFDEPLQNPSHATTGILTQSSGTHPSLSAGQNVISNRTFQRLSFGV